MYSSFAGSSTRPVTWILGCAMGALLFLSGAPSASHAASAAVRAPAMLGAPSSTGCASSEATSPEYYKFELVTTRNVPGTGRSSGVGQVTFSSSPFSISVGGDGSYRYDLRVEGVNLRAPSEGVFVAWAMTPELDNVVRLGALDAALSASGRVEWNKFLVAITLETEDDPAATRWAGPVVMRGVSRSGLMHTLAGHGPFEQELCTKYGFGN